MHPLTQAEIDRFQSVASVLTVRVDKALNELMEQCRGDVEAHIGVSLEESALIAAGVTIAVLLKQLRTAGCPEEQLQQVTATAQVLEQFIRLP